MKTAFFVVFSFGAGVLVYDIMAAKQQERGYKVLEQLRRECKADHPKWASKVLLDSITSKPYCLLTLNDGKHTVEMVKPMKGDM